MSKTNAPTVHTRRRIASAQRASPPRPHASPEQRTAHGTHGWHGRIGLAAKRHKIRKKIPRRYERGQLVQREPVAPAWASGVRLRRARP